MPIENAQPSRNTRLATKLTQLLVCAVLGLPVHAIAQELDVSPDEMIRCFAIEYTVGEESGSCDKLAPGAIAVMTHPDKYSSYVEEVMDGLEQLAITHDESRVRVAAALYLMAPGNKDLVSANPAGVVHRVTRLYGQSSEPAVRAMIIRWMPYQAEVSEAVAFLEATAKSNVSPADRMWPEEALAVDALARMDKEGRAALSRLYESGEVEQEVARKRLEYLEQRGYEIKSVHKGHSPR